MPTRPPGTPDVDLTFDGASGTINGGVFMTGLPQGETVQFSSFLEIRNNGVEQGYNTDGALQQNQQDVQNSTHSILLAEVPIFIGDGSGGTVEGTPYRVFHLNIAEAGTTGQYLSLDALQIWQEESGSLTNFTAGLGFAGSHTNYLAYDLDAGGDRWIGLKEPDNGNGAQQTEFTILIPDSAFINDPEHRYITVYSEFGLQAGWAADSGSEQWSLDGASGGPVSAMTVHKTATVPGGTANAAGEVIAYDITVANVGNTNLTGVTVSDPSVSNLAGVDANFDGFNDGDTNHDNQLGTGETWQYTASYTVTQNDINTLGDGRGVILNTVTADTLQTSPVSASASVTVENSASIELTKTSDVGSVDGAGDVINYNIAVTNTGNVTLTNLIVSDPQFTLATPILDENAPILGTEPFTVPVLVGDYNIGDTNQNGFEDPGETFVFVNIGDTNQNGVEDDGETFQFANAGDTNHDGHVDPGETFQYYNAGDTDQDGVEDDGETFQFVISHDLAGVDSDHDGFNDGDANHNGAFDIGEIWTFNVSYTVTQDDIDNGGIVDPALTHDNTASALTNEGATGSASASVDIIQNPHVTLTKSATVADGTANAAGDEINYTITVTNDGNMTLTSPVVSDPSVTGLAAVLSGGFNAGDADQDGKIDLGEMWQYTAHHTVTQADIDNGGVVNPALTYNNTASVTTAQGRQEVNADPDANDTGSASVPIVQNPHVTLTKSAAVVGGVVDAAGDVIHYRINVTNDGNMTLTSPVVSDPSVSDLAYDSGDNGNGVLDLGETWHYTANHMVTQADIDNGGVVNPALTYNNTATVTTAQGTQLVNADPDANDTGSASVPIVQNPDLTIAKTADRASVNAAGDVINYTVTVDNIGNMTLTGVTLTDSLTTMTLASGDTDSDGKLDVTETWVYTGSYTVQQSDLNTNGGGDGDIDNTATVDTAQTAPESASAAVTVPPPAPAALFFDKSDLVGTHFVDSDEDGHADEGTDLVQWAFQISNTGGVVLHDVTIDDPLFGGTIYGPEVLDPGETFTFTLNHFLTAADVAAHNVHNAGTATGLDPMNNLISVMAQYDQSLPI